MKYNRFANDPVVGVEVKGDNFCIFALCCGVCVDRSSREAGTRLQARRALIVKRGNRYGLTQPPRERSSRSALYDYISLVLVVLIY